MDKTVLISTGIHNRAFILPYYLEHIRSIDYPKRLISIFWLVNNCKDNSLEILRKFKDDNPEYKEIIILVEDSPIKFVDKRETTLREKHTYSWLSYIRNKILKKCVQLNCDYLLSSDSDILVPPDVINSLIRADVDVCAGLLYNGYEYSEDLKGSSDVNVLLKNAMLFDNILRKTDRGDYAHIVNYYTKNPHKCEDSKLISVDFTGACVLMKQAVCKVSKYSDKGSQGEDEKWSESVLQAGFEMFCKPSVYCQHIMNETWLKRYINGELKHWD